MIPAVMKNREFLPFSSSRKGRQSSNAQESRASQVNDQTLAILHGRTHEKRGGGSTQVTQAKSAQQNPPHQRKPLPHPESHSSQQNQLSSRKRPLDHMEQWSSQRRKRRADGPSNQRPAQRRAAAQLKDEAYMRKTLQVPTPQDYPELPPNFFKNVKASIFNAVQGLAELRSEFKSLPQDVEQCTLHFESAARAEVVVGEGRTNVGPLLCFRPSF